jgi:hypothetical protein
LTFEAPVFLSIQLFVPDMMQLYTVLRMIDNDSIQEIPQGFYQLKPRLYYPNAVSLDMLARKLSFIFFAEGIHHHGRLQNANATTGSEMEVTVYFRTIQYLQQLGSRSRNTVCDTGA